MALSRTLAAVAVSLSLGASGAARAAWPERPVTLVVPYAAGGITDVLARLTTERLEGRLKQTFIIENAAGASGTTAALRVKRSAADGYTLFFTTTTQMAIAPLTMTLAYDPIKDFTPISVIATSPYVITVGKGIPVTTLGELIAWAKERPGQIAYGSGGLTTQTHLTSALFARAAGLQLNHVPYKGVGPAFQDLIAGHIAMLAATPVELKPFLGSGQLRPLAVSDTKRNRAVPDLPTISEVVPIPKVVTWNGVVAPAGTPKDVIDLLSREIMAAEQDPAFLEKLDRIGVDPIVHTPEDFAELIRDETERWRGIVRDFGLGPKSTN